jgi:hypothetical protein
MNTLRLRLHNNTKGIRVQLPEIHNPFYMAVSTQPPRLHKTWEVARLPTSQLTVLTLQYRKKYLRHPNSLSVYAPHWRWDAVYSLIYLIRAPNSRSKCQRAGKIPSYVLNFENFQKRNGNTMLYIDSKWKYIIISSIV